MSSSAEEIHSNESEEQIAIPYFRARVHLGAVAIGVITAAVTAAETGHDMLATSWSAMSGAIGGLAISKLAEGVIGSVYVLRHREQISQSFQSSNTE